MSVNKNNLSDIADYHEKIKFFEELFNLDYNPTEMMVTVERNGKVNDNIFKHRSVVIFTYSDKRAHESTTSKGLISHLECFAISK